MPVEAAAVEGSSPHTRGAHSGSPEGIRTPGIIPAYAGSTACPASTPGTARDHPRIRGEHVASTSKTRRGGGSSPHTRGAPCRRCSRRARWGIIPAYAGSTRQLHQLGHLLPDHPRIRGEHATNASSPIVTSGSSPHTRGAPYRRRHRRLSQRIIPAYAGSTQSLVYPKAFSWDHPRIRGEHVFLSLFVPMSSGSSPHTRGARVFLSLSVVPMGIIPAYAGSTVVLDIVPGLFEDHPRIRGEHGVQVLQEPQAVGSSPHTRGALDG